MAVVQPIRDPSPSPHVDLAQVRALIAPVYADRKLHTGETYLAHADGIAATVRALRDDPDLLAAAYLFGAYDVLKDADDWLRKRCGDGVARLVADLRQLMKLSERTRPRVGRRGRAGRSGATHAAGDVQRPARRAAAPGLAPADAALVRVEQGRRSDRVRARDDGAVRAAGQPAGRVAAQVGARGPGIPFPRTRDVQAGSALARRQAHRARSVHRGRQGRTRGHARGGGRASGGQRPPEAHLQHLEQDARQAARLRRAARRARAAGHRRRSRAVLSGAVARAPALDAGRRRVRRLHRQAQGQRLPVAAHGGEDRGGAHARDPDPHAAHARLRRARRGRALAVQGRRQGRSMRTPSALPGCASCLPGARKSMRRRPAHRRARTTASTC